jgi:hypothetical protein
VVCLSHDDVGWLKTLDEYYDDQVRSIFDSTVDALFQRPDRRFNQVHYIDSLRPPFIITTSRLTRPVYWNITG